MNCTSQGLNGTSAPGSSASGTIERAFAAPGTFTALSGAFPGILVGEMCNDGLFTLSANLVIENGTGSDSTHYKELTVRTGESLWDTSTNPVTYDQSKGVAIDTTSDYNIASSENYSRFSRLQITSGFFSANGIIAINGTNPLVEKILMQHTGSLTSGAYGFYCTGASPIIRKCVSLGNKLSGGKIHTHIFVSQSTSTVEDCTILSSNVDTNDTNGILKYSGTGGTFNNNLILGTITNCYSGVASSGIHNAASDASNASNWGTSPISSLTPSAELTGTTHGAQNATPKAGNHIQFGSSSGTDAFGTTRASPSTIGAVELPPSAPPLDPMFVKGTSLASQVNAILCM
jgi:hypothetical protein